MVPEPASVLVGSRRPLTNEAAEKCMSLSRGLMGVEDSGKIRLTRQIMGLMNTSKLETSVNPG